MSETPSQIHNRIAMAAVRDIVKAGSPTEALIILESVVVGVVLALAAPGGAAVVHGQVFAGAAARLIKGETAKQQRARLKAEAPGGHA